MDAVALSDEHQQYADYRTLGLTEFSHLEVLNLGCCVILGCGIWGVVQLVPLWAALYNMTPKRMFAVASVSFIPQQSYALDYESPI